MVMVAVRAKGAPWGRTLCCDLLAVGDMHRGPTTVDVTLYFRGNTNETPPKSLHNQSHDLCIHLLHTNKKNITPPPAMNAANSHITLTGTAITPFP